MAEENKGMGNDTENQNTDKKKQSKLTTTHKILIVGFAIVLIALGIVGYLIYQSLMKEEPVTDVTDASDSYLIDESNLEDVVSNIEARVKDSMFEFNMNVRWYFPNGTSASSNARIGNSSDNTYPIAFEIILEGEEEPVYTSSIIPVGSQLGKLVLERDLSQGEYPAVCMYYILDEEGNVKYSTGVNITLVIQE